MDAQGRALAVWFQNGVNKIAANRFTPGSGWGTAVPISAQLASCEPTIAVNQDGDAVASWEQWHVRDPTTVWVAHFDGDTGSWGARCSSTHPKRTTPM